MAILSFGLIIIAIIVVTYSLVTCIIEYIFKKKGTPIQPGRFSWLNNALKLYSLCVIVMSALIGTLFGYLFAWVSVAVTAIILPVILIVGFIIAIFKKKRI